MNFYNLNESMKIALGHASQQKESVDNNYLLTIKKLSTKLQEKSNKYVPLVRFVARNPKMLSLLEDLIEETSTMNASIGKNVFKNKNL